MNEYPAFYLTVDGEKGYVKVHVDKPSLARGYDAGGNEMIWWDGRRGLYVGKYNNAFGKRREMALYAVYLTGECRLKIEEIPYDEWEDKPR